MKRIVIWGVFFAFVFLGCNKPVQETQAVTTESTAPGTTAKSAPKGKAAGTFQPFLLYGDKGSANNHFIPSGFMPDGQCLAINDTWVENCQSGKTCIKITYDIECSRQGAKWVGLYWQNPANNWGNRKGGFDLTGATKLTFWARGEKGGERIEEFKMGGVSGDYPDSDSAMIGPVILTQEWKEYSVDLRGKDLSYISGGFAWATNAEVNPQSCVFYLDNIQYE